jgi:predicted acetyltransferase
MNIKIEKVTIREKDTLRNLWFVLVVAEKSDNGEKFSIAEFFIMKKYRRRGIGNKVAKDIFDRHKGDWEIHQLKSNLPAQAFWKKVIAEYTGEKYIDRQVVQQFSNIF